MTRDPRIIRNVEPQSYGPDLHGMGEIISRRWQHQWEPYTGILTTEPYATQVQAMGLGPHTRTCTICGVLSSDDDDCGDLECAPDRHR